VVGRALLAVALLALGQPALATDRVEHQVQTANFTYVPHEIAIASGDSLLHRNFDLDPHDLVSDDLGPDGKPWFQSELIGPNETADVPVEDLPSGKYPFYCSIHPFQRGTLYVDEVPDPDLGVEPPPVDVPEPAEPGDVTVQSGDDFFAPKTLAVPVGTTVSWTNTGNSDHTVTASDGSWDSDPFCPTTSECLEPGETFRYTFDEPGTVPYYCKLHGIPSGFGHAGAIVVEEPGAPTTVDSMGVGVFGDGVTVGGGANFGGEDPIPFAADPTGDAPVPQIAGRTGTDLVGAAIYRPDPAIASVFLEWRVADLPDDVPIAVRYTLPFRLGDETYQVVARRSGALGLATGDPESQGAHAAHGFQLRGDCIDGLRCTHLQWLTGSFVPEDDLVRVKLPLGALPGLTGGATLMGPTGDPGLSQVQAALESGQADSASWGAFTYRVAEREVLLGIAPAGTPEGEVEFTTTASIDPSGGFGGSVALPGPGEWDVWARACFGTSCGTGVRRVTA